MRGRSGCPTGQEKNSVGATGESLSDFLQGKVGYRVAPSSDPASPAHLPPEGKALGEMSPIWKPSFTKMLFSMFSLENASQIGFRIPEGIAPRTDQRQRSPKRASDSKRTIKPGVQGRSPGPLSPHFSGEMGTPAGQAGPPGRCAPRPVSALPTRRVRSTGLPLAGGEAGWDRRRFRPARWFPARSRAGDPGFL